MRPTWTSAGNLQTVLLGLAPGGVCLAAASPRRRCALTAPFHPCRRRGHVRPRRLGGVFLWHFPAGFPGSDFPTTLALRCPDFPRTSVFSPAPAAVLSATVKSSSAGLASPYNGGRSRPLFGGGRERRESLQIRYATARQALAHPFEVLLR